MNKININNNNNNYINNNSNLISETNRKSINFNSN